MADATGGVILVNGAWKMQRRSANIEVHVKSKLLDFLRYELHNLATSSFIGSSTDGANGLSKRDPSWARALAVKSTWPSFDWRSSTDLLHFAQQHINTCSQILRPDSPRSSPDIKRHALPMPMSSSPEDAGCRTSHENAGAMLVAQ